jgi:hypothetical protein
VIAESESDWEIITKRMTGDTHVAPSPPLIPRERLRFWELLGRDDKSICLQRQPKLSVLVSKTSHSKNDALFLEVLRYLKSFVVRGEPSDTARGLVRRGNGASAVLNLFPVTLCRLPRIEILRSAM